MTENNYKVLIADNDIHFLEIAKTKLSSRGFQVRTCSNSNDTIKILEENGCDSLLININHAEERMALIKYVESMEVKPLLL